MNPEHIFIGMIALGLLILLLDRLRHRIWP
jgi:hypothetical protein